MIVSLMNGLYVHVPIALTVTTQNRVRPDGYLRRDVLSAKGATFSDDQ
jgi:hypothetical protein